MTSVGKKKDTSGKTNDLTKAVQRQVLSSPHDYHSLEQDINTLFPLHSCLTQSIGRNLEFFSLYRWNAVFKTDKEIADKYYQTTPLTIHHFFFDYIHLLMFEEVHDSSIMPGARASSTCPMNGFISGFSTGGIPFRHSL